jgi:carbon storage regulator
MLILSRRVGEELMIDGEIRIKVVSIKGDRVRLGIEAPPTVRVDRLEVHERRLAEETNGLVPAGATQGR